MLSQPRMRFDRDEAIAEASKPEPSVPFAPGSNTSFKAALAESRNPERGVKLMKLLNAYRHAPDGLVDLEASDVTGIRLSSVCSLRHNLMEDGLVGQGGERAGPHGRANTIFFYIGEK